MYGFPPHAREGVSPRTAGPDPAPDAFAGEDPASYEGLRQSLVADLAPGSPYERVLAENLVTLEWEAVRYRRMRDEIIRSEARDLAVGAFAGGGPRRLSSRDDRHQALANDLVSGDPKRVRRAETALKPREIGSAEIIARAYAAVAAQIEPLERKLAEFETRRRRLREEYDRLKGTRGRDVEDAEILG